MQNKTSIVAVAIVTDDYNVQIFTDTGEVFMIPQGHISEPDVIYKAVSEINKNGSAVVPLVKEYEDSGKSEYFIKSEEKSKGLVRFFRVAREKVNQFFDKQEKAQLDLHLSNTKGSARNQKKKAKDVEKRLSDEHRQFIEEITSETSDATPKQSLDSRKTSEYEYTTVAVTKDKVIPDADKLESHLAHSTSIEDFAGYERLIERLSAVISSRVYSVRDLLSFLETSNLLIAADGSIVGFKKLRAESEEHNLYSDIHSGTVKQGVGYEVYMDINQVDPSRHKSCSHGLHVASRGYLSSFGNTNSVALIRFNPEDVIATPKESTSKIRVCRYFIEHIYPTSSPYWNKICNRPDSKLDMPELTKVLSGKYTPVTHRSYVKKSGSNALVTKLNGQSTPKTEPVKEVSASKAMVTPTVTKPKKDNTQAKKVSLKNKGASASANSAKMLKLVPVKNKKDAKTLLAWKRKQKKSWERLGISLEEGTKITNLAKD